MEYLTSINDKFDVFCLTIFTCSVCTVFAHGNAYAYKTYEFIWKLANRPTVNLFIHLNRRGSVVRRQPLAGGLFLIYALTCDHLVGKESAVGQLTRPTQPSIPSESSSNPFPYMDYGGGNH